MKNFRTILVAAFVALFACNLSAQPMKDADKLAIGSLYPEATNLSTQAGNLLQNNIIQAISLNGISAIDSRFMVLPRIAIVEQTVTKTAPPKFVTKIEVSLFLVDLQSQSILNQTMIETKGIGNNVDHAMMAAIRNISSRNARLKSFIVKGKETIIEYFESNAEQIVLRTRAHIARGDYQSAMKEINFVPAACSELYNTMSELLSNIPADQQTCPNYQCEATQNWLKQVR